MYGNSIKIIKNIKCLFFVDASELNYLDKKFNHYDLNLFHEVKNNKTWNNNKKLWKKI